MCTANIQQTIFQNEVQFENEVQQCFVLLENSPAKALSLQLSRGSKRSELLGGKVKLVVTESSRWIYSTTVTVMNFELFW